MDKYTIGQTAFIIRDWLFKSSLVDEFKKIHENFITETMNRLFVADIDPKYEKKNRLLFLYILWKCNSITPDLVNVGSIKLPYNYIFKTILDMVEESNIPEIQSGTYNFFYSVIKFIGQYTNSEDNFIYANNIMKKCIIFSGIQVIPSDCLYLFNFNQNYRDRLLTEPIAKNKYLNRLFAFNNPGIRLSAGELEEYYDNYRLNFAYKNFIEHNNYVSFAYLLDTIISMVRMKDKKITELKPIFGGFVKRKQWNLHYDSFLEMIFEQNIEPAHTFGFNKFNVMINPNSVILSKMALLHKKQDNKNEIRTILDDAIRVPHNSFVKYIEYIDKIGGAILLDASDLVNIRLFINICKNNYLTEKEYDTYIKKGLELFNECAVKLLTFHKNKTAYDVDTFPIESALPKYFLTNVGTSCNQITSGPTFLNIPNFL